MAASLDHPSTPSDHAPTAPCVRCGATFAVIVGPNPHRYCSRLCRDRAASARKSSARRRAERLHARTLLLFLLWRREGGRCYLCGLSVDLAVTDPNDPAAPTRDHIYPRSRGGSDHPSNLAVTHRRCNEAKGDAVIPDLSTLAVPADRFSIPTTEGTAR